MFADDLRKKEGVNLDKLTQIMRVSFKNKAGVGPVAIQYQTLTNTNSWRTPDNNRESYENTNTVFAVERFNSK